MGFECDRCRDNFSTKQKLQSHQVRKFPCRKVHRCKDCNQDFGDNTKLIRHSESEKHRLNSKINQLLSTSNTVTNSQLVSIVGDKNTSNNVNVVININGTEDYGMIKAEKLVQIFKRHVDNVRTILYIIEMINFNPEFPENHNIYISNKRTKDINVFGQNGWEIKGKTYSKDIILSTIKFIRRVFEDHLNTFDKNEKERYFAFRHYTRVPEDELLNDKKFKSFQSDVLCYLYNNRDMVLNVLSK